MLATVSARVPVEVRNQVHKKLRNAGSTPSEFINEVYLKFLDDELDLKTKKENGAKKAERKNITDILRSSTCNFENPLPATFDFKAELEQGRTKGYEAL